MRVHVSPRGRPSGLNASPAPCPVCHPQTALRPSGVGRENAWDPSTASESSDRTTWSLKALATTCPARLPGPAGPTAVPACFRSLRDMVRTLALYQDHQEQRAHGSSGTQGTRSWWLLRSMVLVRSARGPDGALVAPRHLAAAIWPVHAPLASLAPVGSDLGLSPRPERGALRGPGVGRGRAGGQAMGWGMEGGLPLPRTPSWNPPAQTHVPGTRGQCGHPGLRVVAAALALCSAGCHTPRAWSAEGPGSRVGQTSGP